MKPYAPQEAPAGYKECARYPGLYVNDEGQVFCERRGQLKLTQHSDGCLVVYYRMLRQPKRQVKVHRLVAEAFLEGFTPECQIDHIFHNRSDNRVSQIRIVTNRGNQQNLKGKKEGAYSSIYPGVCFCNRDKQWKAAVLHERTQFNLGLYATEEEAYKAYLYGVMHPEELACRKANRMADKKAKL